MKMGAPLTAAPGVMTPNELVLQKVLAGYRRAGASTETVYLRHYQVKDCLGCFSCWLQTWVDCVQKDDMSVRAFRAVPGGRPRGVGHAGGIDHECAHENRADHAHD